MSDASHPVVLITGSSGFLGQAIARGRMERYRVIGLDAKQPRQEVVTVKIDLTSDESVDEAMTQIRESARNHIASVIHLAAYYGTTGEDNAKYDAVTVQGTRALLGAVKEFETDQFVFSSTLLVHAPSPDKDERINEESPLDPAWAYPPSKVETEALIAAERGASGRSFLGWSAFTTRTAGRLSSRSRSPASSSGCPPPICLLVISAVDSHT